MRASHGFLALLITLTACSGKKRPFGEGSIEGLGGTSGDAAPAAELETATTPGAGVTPVIIGGEPLGGAAIDMLSQPDDALLGSGNLACDAAACTDPDAGPPPPICVPTGPRNCTSDVDNDCDGQPDNVLDDVCVCALGVSEACEEHPGLDGNGPCRAGLRTCVLAADGFRSEWGACDGSVGPGGPDSCTERGDDADCDGTPNSDCPCVDGDMQQCGSSTDTGPCVIGTSTCSGGRFGDCVGATPPAAQDSCVPGDDSNCNGRVNDRFCGCLDGAVDECGVTDTGACVLGTRMCRNGSFGPCGGNVDPRGRDCRSQQDNDCDGRADNTRDNVCACTVGSMLACQTHPQDGIGRCRAGSQTCIAGPGNSSSSLGACTGSAGPLPRDCRSAQDNDCDGRPDNTIDNVCQCVPGQGNGPCSGDRNNSRCNDQGRCAPCQSNADCSLSVPGGACQNGVCRAPTLPTGATCTDNGQCSSGRCETWFRDRDGDGFGTTDDLQRTCGAASGSSLPPMGYTATAGDCCDLGGANAVQARTIFPGQTQFFDVPQAICPAIPSRDYNCSEDIEFLHQDATLRGGGGCAFTGCNGTTVWDLARTGGTPPPCGNAGPITNCSGASGACTATPAGFTINFCH